MLFLSNNQSYPLTDIGTCNLMDHSKTKNNTSQTYTVMQSHTGTTGSNVMVHIEVNQI